MTGIAQHTLVEAVDGPAAIHELVGKGMPVLTRLASGGRGFRILSKVTASPEPVAVVRITLDTGRTATIAAEQIVYRGGSIAVKASELRPGDVLEASFHYPPGYRLRDAAGAEVDGAGHSGVLVTAIEPGGKDVVYTGRVNETGCLFLTCGILCRL
jgi:hypothetical protein